MSPYEILLLFPLFGIAMVYASPRSSESAYRSPLIVSLLTFLGALTLIPPAMRNGGQFTSEVNRLWINSPGLQIRFHLGVDGLNLWLIVLTTFLVPIAIWMSRTMIKERHRSFFALLLLFEFGLIGVFSALDLFVFYVFWEIALVPMYLMVGGWGARRTATAVKFFVYTFLGSVAMLLGFIGLYLERHTFEFRGLVLLQQGKFQQAVEDLRRGHELGSRQSTWRYPSAEWLRNAREGGW